MGRLLRALILLSAIAAAVAWFVDSWLRDRGAGDSPDPIRTTVVVNAPIDRVWAVLSDIERQPDWMHDLKSVRLTTPPPTRVGTRGLGRVRVFGVSVEDPVEVIAFKPPTHFAIRHEGLVAGGGDIRLERGADGTTTTVTWNETLIPPILPHLGRRLLGALFEPIFRRDLERLAAVVESA